MSNSGIQLRKIIEREQSVYLRTLEDLKYADIYRRGNEAIHIIHTKPFLNTRTDDANLHYIPEPCKT